MVFQPYLHGQLSGKLMTLLSSSMHHLKMCDQMLTTFLTLFHGSVYVSLLYEMGLTEMKQKEVSKNEFVLK